MGEIRQVEGVVSPYAGLIERGLIGACKRGESEEMVRVQSSGTSTGWPWFVRITYDGTSKKCTSDVLFASLSEADRFVSHITSRKNVDCIIGDD